MLHAIFSLIETSGWPGQALLAVSTVLWMAVWRRAANLQPSVERGFRRELEAGGAEAAPGVLRDRIADRLGAGRDLIRTLVVVAPLLGLLGTVGGMVVLFDSLHGGSGAVGRDSIARGISTALVTTQLGLIVGVPGLVMARLLEQREQRLLTRLDEVVTAWRASPPSEARVSS